jgi:protocatechuate 3,4-dioxygenase beta subunit
MASGLARAAIPATPSQVEGPFHPVDEQADTDTDMCMIRGHLEPAIGEQILVRGQIKDAHGQPVKGALVDVWQANHHGRYSHPKDPNTAPLDPNFQGWALIKSGEDGRYGFKTIKPGPYSLEFLGGEGWRCRHIHFRVSKPGLSTLTTQMYFDGDPLIEQDLEIAKAPEDQRHRLIARMTQDQSTGLPLYQFDLVLA